MTDDPRATVPAPPAPAAPIAATRLLWRRGAAAIAGTGGDGTALALLAAGAAAGALAWAIAGRRRRS